MKIKRRLRCAWIIRPGEMTIDVWDGKQCAETHPMLLTTCDHCGKEFCLLSHWHKHLDEIHPCEMPTDHPYYSDKEHCEKCKGENGDG